MTPRDLGQLRRRVHLACRRLRIPVHEAARQIGVSVQAIRALGTVRAQRSTVAAVAGWLARHPEPQAHCPSRRRMAPCS